MAYGYCTLTNTPLGTYTYTYNPLESTNPQVRIVAEAPTLSGRYYTDWGTSSARRDITHRWPAMDAAFFNSLTNYALAGGTVTFVDELGTSFTVIPMPPTWKRIYPQADGYDSVEFTMKVVSQP